jgi:hypothetical protein
MAHSMPQTSRRTEREDPNRCAELDASGKPAHQGLSSDQVNRSERSTPDNGSPFVALAAFVQDGSIGIVRIIDLGDGRGELAVEVVDRWQGCGVGTNCCRPPRTGPPTWATASSSARCSW